MIQRIQTVWLLLAGLALLLTIKFPTYVVTDPALSGGELNAFTAGIITAVLTVVLAVVCFIMIGLYKNRPLQLKLCVLGILVELLIVFLYFKQASHYQKTWIHVASALHVAVTVFFILAARGISKDEKLIKESDRLR